MNYFNKGTKQRRESLLKGELLEADRKILIKHLAVLDLFAFIIRQVCIKVKVKQEKKIKIALYKITMISLCSLITS